MKKLILTLTAFAALASIGSAQAFFWWWGGYGGGCCGSSYGYSPYYNYGCGCGYSSCGCC